MTVNAALDATELARLNAKTHDAPVYLSFEPETEVGHATVNGTPATFPVTQLTVTGATAGWTDQRAGQRVKITRSGVLIGYYRCRKVGDATTLYLNEIMDSDPGLISILARTTGIQDGDLVTICENYDLTSRKPYTADYQDVDIAVADYNFKPPPIVNMTINDQPGDYACQVAQGDTQAITAAVAVTKHATLAGSTLSYGWAYPASFTGVSGFATATLTATAPVGSHRVYCTVTDSLGGAITVTRWIRVHDPSDPPLAIFPPSGDERDLQWRHATVKLKQSTISVIPPGARCIVWSDGTWNSLDVASATKKFVGFAANQPFRLEPGYHESELEIIGSCGILDKLYGYPTTFGFTGTVSSWETLNVNLSTVHFMMWWVLQWRCANFLTTFDYDPISTSLSINVRKTVNIAPGSIYSQLKYLADMMDANVGSRSDGGIVCRAIPSMLEDRSAVVTRATLDYTQYSFTAPLWQRRPTTGAARWEGYLSSYLTDTRLIAQAPGEDTLGSYNGQTSGNDKVFASQTDANQRAGRALARANNEYPQIQIELPSNFDAFEPVDMQRVVLVVPASKSPTGAQISITAMPTSVTKQWIAGRKAKIGMQLVAETDGVAGVTVVVPSQVTSGTRYTRTPTPRTTAVTGIGTPTHNGGTVIAVNNNKIGITVTWFGSAVLWIDITGTGLSGTILHLGLDPFSDFLGSAQTGNLGAWCLTTAGLYHTPNILTTNPIWTQKKTFTPAPATGLLRTPIWAQGVVYVAWEDSNYATVTSKVYLGKYSAYGATTDWTTDVGSANNEIFGFDIGQSGTDEALVSAKDLAITSGAVYRVLSGTPSRIAGTAQTSAPMQFIQKPLYTFGGVANTDTGSSECFVYGQVVSGSGKFYKTANGGTSVTDITPASNKLAPFTSSSMCFTDDANRIAFLAETGGLWTSTDAGANWTSRGGTSANASRTIGYFPRLVAGNWALYFSGTTAITYSPDFGTSFQDKTGNWQSAIGSMTSFSQVLPLY